DAEAGRAFPRSTFESHSDGRYAALGLATEPHVVLIRRAAAPIVFPGQLLSAWELAGFRGRPGPRAREPLRQSVEMRLCGADPNGEGQSSGRACSHHFQASV